MAKNTNKVYPEQPSVSLDASTTDDFSYRSFNSSLSDLEIVKSLQKLRQTHQKVCFVKCFHLDLIRLWVE